MRVITHLYSLLALCFLVTLLAQISEKEPVKVTLLGQHSHTHHDDRFINGNNANDNPDGNSDSSTINNANKFYVNILDMDLFPGPHREKRLQVGLNCFLFSITARQYCFQ